jgi:hypothetical protein
VYHIHEQKASSTPGESPIIGASFADATVLRVNPMRVSYDDLSDWSVEMSVALYRILQEDRTQAVVMAIHQHIVR